LRTLQFGLNASDRAGFCDGGALCTQPIEASSQSHALGRDLAAHGRGVSDVQRREPDRSHERDHDRDGPERPRHTRAGAVALDPKRSSSSRQEER
jgi:hypothetical protein